MTILDVLGDDHARIALLLEAAASDDREADATRARIRRLVADHVAAARRLYQLLDPFEDLRPQLARARQSDGELATLAERLAVAEQNHHDDAVALGHALAAHDVEARELHAAAHRLLARENLEHAFYECQRARAHQSETAFLIFRRAGSASGSPT